MKNSLNYIYIYIYIYIQFLVFDTKGVGLDLSERFFRGGKLRSFLKNIRLLPWALIKHLRVFLIFCFFGFFIARS